jgi:hypothetical protein
MFYLDVEQWKEDLLNLLKHLPSIIAWVFYLIYKKIENKFHQKT